jgi:hypothetical protein
VAAADPHGRGVGGSVRGRAVAGRSRGRARDRGRDRATKKRRRFDTRGTREIEERSHCLPIRHIINQFRHSIYTVSRSNAPFLEPITSLDCRFPARFPIPCPPETPKDARRDEIFFRKCCSRE